MPTQTVSTGDPPLTPYQYSSLLEVARVGTMRREIPREHQGFLFELGYIELQMGVPAITPSGKLRVEAGK